MGKGDADVNDIIKTIELLCSADIQLATGLIIGFPGELKSDFSYTWKKALELSEKYPKNFTINPQLFQLRPPSTCFEKYYNYGLIVKKWNQKISHAIPEVSDIIKNMPMIFFGGRPKNRETLHRFDMISNIVRHDKNIYESGAEKDFLKECLKHIRKTSIISITTSFKISSCSKATGKSKTTYSLIDYPPNKLVLLDKEMFILKCLNGRNSIADIVTMLFLYCHKDRRKSYKLLLQFLAHLIDNNIFFRIH
jgi:hypothetical protein